jgi:hypothetical protein
MHAIVLRSLALTECFQFKLFYLHLTLHILLREGVLFKISILGIYQFILEVS